MSKLAHTGIALADLAEASLKSKITSFFDSRDRSGREGLRLLDVCIQRAASQSRDWDGLARFFHRVQGTSQLGIAKKVIRAAFGSKLSYKANAKHDAGGTFTIGWEGSFNLIDSPTYKVVAAAITANEGWDSKAFNLRLNDTLPKIEAAPRKVTQEATDKAVKHLLDYTKRIRGEGFNIGEIMAAVQKQLAALPPVDKSVEKKVVNGVTVLEPNF